MYAMNRMVVVEEGSAVAPFSWKLSIQLQRNHQLSLASWQPSLARKLAAFPRNAAGKPPESWQLS